MSNPINISSLYETPRLNLVLLTEKDASRVLLFQQKNASVFQAFEPDYQDQFYTLAYQKALLSMEEKLLQQQNGLRFWITLRQEPETLIGTVSFHYILKDPFFSCQIGYKLDPDYWGHGYATEALSMAITCAASYFPLHRIEALVLPDNQPSIRLLKRHQFQEEALVREAVRMKGCWRDHYRYVLLLPL